MIYEFYDSHGSEVVSMFFEVEFSDGTTAQLVANDRFDARRLAISSFKDKVVVAVKKAGLMGMTQRAPRSTDES
jgi:hypothetical protein